MELNLVVLSGHLAANVAPTTDAEGVTTFAVMVVSDAGAPTRVVVRATPDVVAPADVRGWRAYDPVWVAGGLSRDFDPTYPSPMIVTARAITHKGVDGARGVDGAEGLGAAEGSMTRGVR